MDQSKDQILKESEENTEFSLREYHKERISFHMKMLNYYLAES
jgi:hypothetical protein